MELVIVLDEFGWWQFGIVDRFIDGWQFRFDFGVVEFDLDGVLFWFVFVLFNELCLIRIVVVGVVLFGDSVVDGFHRVHEVVVVGDVMWCNMS